MVRTVFFSKQEEEFRMNHDSSGFADDTRIMSVMRFVFVAHQVDEVAFHNMSITPFPNTPSPYIERTHFDFGEMIVQLSMSSSLSHTHETYAYILSVQRPSHEPYIASSVFSRGSLVSSKRFLELGTSHLRTRSSRTET